MVLPSGVTDGAGATAGAGIRASSRWEQAAARRIVAGTR